MLFSKRPGELTPEDIQRVVSEEVPEGSEVEFKKGLSTRDGRDHPWVIGGEIGDHARNKLLAEVVAFANTYGGWLLVGIDETEDKPPRAATPVAIRACAELAERLRLMCRDCIDPRLPVLEVEGVPMREDGAGVVVFHVPRSRMAPHRLKPTKECYRRHADRTEEMTMREIQDLTLQVERGMAAIDHQFKERQEAFKKSFEQFRGGTSRAFGLRATLVPLTPIYVDRVHGNEAVRPPSRTLWGRMANGNSYDLSVPSVRGSWRPIIRGSVLDDDYDRSRYSPEVHCDGLIEYRLMYRMEGEPTPGERPLHLPVQLVMGVFGNALCAAEKFRRAASAPDAEYGLELEIANPETDLPIGIYGGSCLGDWLGPLPWGHTVFPRYSIGPAKEFQNVFEVFQRDFWNAAGRDFPSELVVDFERAFRELGLIADASGS